MRNFILVFCLLLASALSGQPPNIVIIVSDDQSFNSIGYTSAGAVYTPTLDMLAQNGMRFTNAHHPVSVCSPSRYSMLTGKFSGRCQGEEYLERFPLGTPTRTENNCELNATELHLGNILKANGYRTGFVGKSHIMEHDILSLANWPSYGLQTYAQGDDPYDPAVDAKMKHNHDVYQSIVRSYGFDYADGIYMGNVKELRNDALNIHNLEWTVDKARNFIEQEKDNPFFLFFSTTLHHGPVPWARNDGKYRSSFDADPKITGEGVVETPWDFMPSRQEIQDQYIAAGFPENEAYALLLDEGIKAIYDKIVELNLDENTLILFMPDHGMWRHGKATLHDFGLKVPMLMYWNGTITAGSVYDGLVQTVDFLPTILELAGIEQPAGLETDGISLKTIIETGSGEAHSSLFGELGYSRAVKTKDWKYIAVRYPDDVQDAIDRGETFTGYQGEILDYPYLTQNSHLGHYAAKNNPHYFELDQLYGLQADSAETVNVLDQHPEVVLQMRELLSEYLQSFENRPYGEFTLTTTDPPLRAHTPVPMHGAADQEVTPTLSWTSEYKATTHDVYFGTTNPPPFVVNQEASEYDPGYLRSNTFYFWRVDAVNAAGSVTEGDIWIFTSGYGNIAPGAAVSVSSTSDSIHFSGDNVKDGIFQTDNTGEWKSDGESNPWLELNWPEEAVVDQINLFDRTATSSQILSADIEFSDGSILETGPLPIDGSKKRLDFDPREISSLKLTVTEGSGELGLAEIEVYDTVMYQPYAVTLPSEMMDFRIIPNPAPSGLITLSGLSEEVQNQISIYNLYGELSSVHQEEGPNIDLDLSYLGRGLYFIQVNSALYKQTRKLIIP